MIEINDIIHVLADEVIEIEGPTFGIFVNGISDKGNENEFTLNWLSSAVKNKMERIEASPAKVHITDSSVVFSSIMSSKNITLIKVKNPKLAVAVVSEHFFLHKPVAGIHHSSVIHSEANVDETVHISPNCTIGKCKIGKGTIIYPNVTLYDQVEIGEYCIIHAGAVIGTDGLGCERKENGELVKFPHLGGVLVGNNVEIGANCQIAKGALSDTIIGEGSKINGLCFIAHNCVLGKNVWITGNTMLAGSVKVGDNVTIYSGVIIREQRLIGRNSTIGMGALVTKDIPEGETWYGIPAKKIEKP